MDRDDLDFDDIIDNLMLSELSDRESSETFEQVVENVLFPTGLLIPEELIVENLPRELVDGEFFVTLSGELIPYDDYIDVLGLMGSEPIEVVSILPFTGGGASRPFVLGDVGPTSDLSDLLPPTALQFTIPEEREFDPFFDEENDTPSLTVALGELLAVDETDVGPTVDGVFAAPLTGMSAGSVLDVDSDFGADGAGSLVYGLSLSGGGVTALTTAVGDFVITLVENPDGSISGTYVDGLGVTQTAFDISIDAGTGVLSYSQYVALEHGDTSDHNDSFDLSGLGITASATVTDSDGDSDSDSVDVGGQITIFDDGPVITSVSASNGFNVDETDVGPTVDGVFAAPLTGMSAGSVLDVDSDFGADGAGSLVYGLSLSGGGVTALTTAVGDFVITLVENPDGSISGTYVDGLGVTQTAFDISIDAGTGVLSYSQYVALEHGDTSDHNDSFDLSGLGITASATVTDSDGDSDSDSVDVGGQITIFDDGPVITSVSASNGFNVDETDVGPTVDGVFAAPLTGMSAGSVLDVDSDFGADGAGSLVYGLSLSGGGVTALTTAVGDFVITLVENPDGSISGTYVDGLGVTQTAFDISIDAGTGVLSYSQYVALEHGDTSDHNDSFDLSGLGITASATVTDSDGDSDSDSVDVGGQITIFDDGPVITSVSASNGFNVDETDVGPTVDGVFAAPLTGMSAGSVLDVDSDFGADGAGSLVYGLSLSGGGVTALTTAVGDFVITLVENPDGSISGTYVDGLGVTQTAFDISIDAGTGVLSYSQYVALEHGDTSDHNDSFDLSGLGITASATVTDSDGDSDSDSVDVGGQITIFDDGPVITSVSASNGFNVDETDVGPTVDGVFAAPLTGMSAGSVLDVDSDFGADGAGSLVYGLSLSGGGVTALTTAVGDFVITLVENPDGSISGTYVDGLGVTQTAFDISIDAGTGVLSYSQYVALEHGDTSDHNDSFDLSGLGITASATVTDSDGDSDSDSVDVGGQITIFDDGPVITSVSASNGFNVDETDVGPTVDGVFAAPLTGMSAGSVLDVDSDFGADGAGSLVYGLSLSGGGVTALTTAVGDFVITLVENPDGSISGTYVDGLGVTQTAFDISIDAGTGVLSYSQYVALEHGDTSDHNDSFDLSGLGITASATVTDSDGDSDSDSVDVGGQITIFDDGPVITSVSASNGFNVDETDVGPTVDGVFAAPLTGMSAGSVLDVDSDFGADGAGSLVYGLSLSGGGVTALTTAVGDFVITLVENPDGSISGTYVDGLGVTQTAFDISIDAGTGVLSYSQYVALEHGDTSDHNDSFDLSGLGITASATVTDSDGDSDSDSVDVGGQITIFDDGPVITSVSASNGFNVDETDVGPTVDGVFAAPLTGMSAGSVLDVDSDFGADGAGSLVYGLSLSGGGVTALTTAVGDFVITLVENPDGSISGTYVDGLGVTQTAFDISIDAGTGVLSYSQYVALEHGDTSDHNDSFDLSGLGITASATVTDSDGDSDSDSVDVGGQITIFDDGLTANDDADTVDEATGSTTLGNVVTGIGDADSALNSDSTSADGPNSMAGDVTDIRTGAEAGVGTDGTIGVALQGTYGTLLINADGSYTYTVTDPDGVPLGAQDIFTYTITDGDGDSDEAELIINVAQNASVPTITDSDVTVFEDGFADGEQHGVGSDVETGTFVINANGEAFTLDIGGTMVSSADLELGNFPAGITTTHGVLTITGYDELSGTVTYSYDLNDVALTHTGQGEINPITETIDISVTDATGDPSTTGSITVSIVDDIPTITASGVNVDEDDLTNGNDGGPDDGPGLLASASGVLTAQYGADGAGDISLELDVTGLTSQGQAVLWDSAANVGFVDANNDGIYTAGTDREVFNVTLDETADGATGYTFNLVDQLDHPAPGIGNSGPATEDNIDLIFTATITDGDGDSAQTNFTVNVDDDSPVNNGNSIVVTVEEDDLASGNNEDGSVNAHIASGAVGALGVLVDVGADEDVSFALVDATTAEALIVGLGLTAGGDAVDGVRFDGSTMYAQAGTTDIFSLTVNADGSWSFELLQSLDHHLDINADDLEALLNLDLSGLISATDFDGDAITLQSGFVVNVQDDIPTIIASGVNVDEDDLTNGNDGGPDDGPGLLASASGVLTAQYGADGAGDISLELDVTGLTSQGQAVLWDSAANVGFVDANNDGIYTAGTDREVFNVTLDETADGATGYTFNLVDQLDHPAPGIGNSGPATEDNIDLIFTATITDGDGDSAQTNFTVNVDDDSPVNNTVQAIEFTVEEDDLPDGNNEDGSVNAHTFSGAINALSAMVNVGADEDVSFGLVDATTAEALIISLGLSSAGVPVDGVRFDGSTIYAQAGATDIFSLTVNSDGSYTFTLIEQLDHHDVSNADNDETATLNLDLSGLISATDFDGDTITLDSAFIVNIEDDIPIGFTPETGAVDNTGVVGTSDVDTFDLNFAAAVGEDQDGSVIFDTALNGTAATDTNGNFLFLGGEQLFWTVDNSGAMPTLIAETAGGTDGIIITIDVTTDSYSVDFEGEIRNGSEIELLVSGSGIGGGNRVGLALVDDPSTLSDGIIFTGTNGGNLTTVNSSSGNLGVGGGAGNWIGATEVIRADFVTDVAEDNTAPLTQSHFTYGQHMSVSSVLQEVSRVQGGGSTTTFRISAYNTDEDDVLILDSADDVQVNLSIADITVYNGDPGAGGVEVVNGTTGLTISESGGVITLSGMQQGWYYEINSSNTFEALELQHVSGAQFNVGNITIGATSNQDPFDIDISIEGRDEDGDTVSSNIGISVQPAVMSPANLEDSDNMGNLDNYAEFSFDGNHIGDNNLDGAANAAMALVAAGALTGQLDGEASAAKWVENAPILDLETVKSSVTSEPDQDYGHFESLGPEATEFAAQFLTEMDSDAGSTVMDAGEFALPSMTLCENYTDGNEVMLIAEPTSSDMGLELTAIDIPEIMTVVDLGTEQPIDAVTQAIDSDFDAEYLLATFFDNSVDDMLENLSLDGTGTQEALGGGLSTELVAEASALFAEYQSNEASHLGPANVESLDDAILLTATLLYI